MDVRLFHYVDNYISTLFENILKPLIIHEYNYIHIVFLIFIWYSKILNIIILRIQS